MPLPSLLLLGCGPGGYSTAAYAARHGFTVTVFEKGELGGTCLNCGCIPTKVFCHTAGALLEARSLSAAGIIAPPSDAPDMAALQRYKDQTIQTLRSGIATLMATPGITLVQGEAVLKDAHTVSCDGHDYTADAIIIATGSHPARLPIPMTGDKIMDSTGVLNLPTVPPSMVIIGAGVIGMEIAAAFNAFGTKVTVIEFLRECLPPMDADLAKRLRKLLEKRGVVFHLQSAAKAIDSGTVTFEEKGVTKTVEGDCVLVATGRQPNVEGLGLDAAGIVYDRHGIKTDDQLQTNIPGVYAIGDVNGRMMLAHAAEQQGRQVVDQLIGRTTHHRPDLVPSAVFTIPELAGVGPTEQQLKAEGRAYTAHKSFYRSNGRAVLMQATDGLVKVLADPDGRLLACHVLGIHAADIVQEATALIQQGATLDDLRAIVHIHPTVNELLREVQ